MLFGTGKRSHLLQGSQLDISINGRLINFATGYKYLGVHLDPNLNLTTHFEKLYWKAVGIVNLLKWIRSFIDVNTAEKIYTTMILPIITYCGSVNLG